MIKIKDNIDLKELEKYGFKYHKDLVYKPKYKEWSVIEVSVDPNTRIIKIAGCPDLFHTVEDTLFDLIQAGLVEKVEKIMDDYTLDLLETKVKRIKELEEYNKKLRDTIEELEDEIEEGQKGWKDLLVSRDNLTSRISKAIKYIEDNACYSKDIEMCCRDLIYSECDELIKILKGEDNEK